MLHQGNIQISLETFVWKEQIGFLHTLFQDLRGHLMDISCETIVATKIQQYQVFSTFFIVTNTVQIVGWHHYYCRQNKDMLSTFDLFSIWKIVVAFSPIQTCRHLSYLVTHQACIIKHCLILPHCVTNRNELHRTFVPVLVDQNVIIKMNKQQKVTSCSQTFIMGPMELESITIFIKCYSLFNGVLYGVVVA